MCSNGYFPCLAMMNICQQHGILRRVQCMRTYFNIFLCSLVANVCQLPTQWKSFVKCNFAHSGVPSKKPHWEDSTSNGIIAMFILIYCYMAVHIIAMHVIAIYAHHWHILGADCGSKTQWKLLSLLYQWARGGVKWNIGHRRLEWEKRSHISGFTRECILIKTCDSRLWGGLLSANNRQRVF